MIGETNSFVHHVGVSLIDGHTFPGEIGGIVYWNSLEIWILGPIFFEDEENVLGFSEGKDGH
jgi:hypothetical protein